MKKLIVSAVFAAGLVAGIEAAPTDAVTQADLQALLTRLTALEAENKLLRAQMSAQSDQLDFYEDCIAEMAAVVYA